MASVYAFIRLCLCLSSRSKQKIFYRIAVETAVMTGVVCLLVGAATCFSWILATHQVPRMLGDFIGSASGGKVVFLFLSIAVFFIFGALLDGLPAILIFFPILYPIAQSLGLHPYHYGVLVIAIIGISVVVPPIGLCLVIICSLAKIKLSDTIQTSDALHRHPGHRFICYRLLALVGPDSSRPYSNFDEKEKCHGKVSR